MDELLKQVQKRHEGLSDPELERQAADRISFRRFLGYPERIPDQTTVWSLRERLAETGKDALLWAELQRQLDSKGFRVRKGVSQDASFISADPGGSAPWRGGGDSSEPGWGLGEEEERLNLRVQASHEGG